MSFYLEDYPDDDGRNPSQTCPNCFGTSFYNDPVTGTLTCSSCYTQSQTDTQEELDYDEGVGLAATSGKKAYNSRGGNGGGSGGRRGGRAGRPLEEYDTSNRLPDAESCCLAFQWLLWDASRHVSKLAGIQEKRALGGNGYYYAVEQNNPCPSIMERTVKRAWFAYLDAWMEATREYSARYPEIRVSFRDYFVEDIRKCHLMRHLSVTVGKRVEDEILEEMQKEQREQQHHSDDERDEGDSSTGSGPSSFNDGNDRSKADDASPPLPSTSSGNPIGKIRKRKHRPFITIAQLCKQAFFTKPKRHPNGIYKMPPHHATLKIKPSLTLLLSILQLALTHLQTGVAPHHLTMWVASGQLPHALNGYALLPSRLKDKVHMVKNFFRRSFVPPAGVVANLTDMLATACSWYGDGIVASKLSYMAASRASLMLDSDARRKSDSSLLNSYIHSSETADLPPSKGSAANSVTSCNTNAIINNSWHCKSLYNVPLLAARMIQDFGFDERVFNNTIALMGVVNDSPNDATVNQDGGSNVSSHTDSINATANQSMKNHVELDTLPSPLDCASPDRLHTPLHIAAVIVVACKLCPGWETWKIINLHANVDSSDPERHSSVMFVPLNESQLQLLGNGPTLDLYTDFLEKTAFHGLDTLTNAAQFFRSLHRDMNSWTHLDKDIAYTKTKESANNSKITPNLFISGAPNPNKPTTNSKLITSPSSTHVQYNKTNNIGCYVSYQCDMQNNEKKLAIKPCHPHYCQLLEYICFIIEETNTVKLHDMVEEFEEELLRPFASCAGTTDL